MKRFTLIVVACLAFTAVFTGCSKNDTVPPDDGTTELLIAFWKAKEFRNYENGEWSELMTPSNYSVIEFKEGGAVIHHSYYGISDEGTYQYNSKTKSLGKNLYTKWVCEFFVEEISETNLVLRLEYEETAQKIYYIKD